VNITLDKEGTTIRLRRISVLPFTAALICGVVLIHFVVGCEYIYYTRE